MLLAGSGPFLLPVAASLLRLGVTVVGVAEAGYPYRIRGRSLPAAGYPQRLGELAGYLATLARRRVPIWSGRVVAEAHAGDAGKVAAVSLADVAAPDRPVARFDIDALCVGYGFRPQIELARLLGCAVRMDEASGDLVPVLDESGRAARDDGTDGPAVWLAGEAGGIAGVHAALAEGELVAAGVLGQTGPWRAARRRRRARRFAELTGRLYPRPTELAARLTAALPDPTPVCRCEAVTAGAIRATADTVHDRAALKAGTRAGMGPCQGRECAPAVAALGRLDGVETVRMPTRPVGLAALAGLGGVDVVPPPADGELTAAGVGPCGS